MLSMPLGTLQTTLVKYIAEFNARAQSANIKALLSRLFKGASLGALATFAVFAVLSAPLMNGLKIQPVSCGFLFALLAATAWISPLMLGGLQGLQLFGWLVLTMILIGALKLVIGFVLIMLGMGVAGAFAGFVVSAVIGILLGVSVLKNFLVPGDSGAAVDLKKFFLYCLPVALTLFCSISLASIDMILVKLFFSIEDAAAYSLAQMLGKIFYFLPGAITIVMFPKASSQNAQKSGTRETLLKSLFYAGALCAAAVIAYNLFPAFVLKVLTGKAPAASILLGRFFSVSMTFFTMTSVLAMYFLSVGDLRFLKYLVALSLAEFLAIMLWHTSLVQVQLVLCVIGGLLFAAHLALALYKNQGGAAKAFVSAG
ncbi:MAG: oligosaccharide flippase family protein, partial [Candidatus Omnitrophica bacterium]|nr:oligosaccharide flippase family protein [Candidatus Omnitrophota bacterium]